MGTELLFGVVLIVELIILIELLLPDKIKIGAIYYDKHENSFFQVREKVGGTHVCSGYARYYSDAKTTTRTMTLSKRFIRACLPVKNLSERPDLWNYYKGIGWKTLEKAERGGG